MDDKQTILWSGVLVIRARRVLVLKESDKSFYVLPGGKLEYGETDEQAAVREVSEELGVEVKMGEVYLEALEPSKSTGQTIRFKLFKADLLTVPDMQKLPGKTEVISWIDSSYVQSGMELGNLLEHHVMPKLIADNLID